MAIKTKTQSQFEAVPVSVPDNEFRNGPTMTAEAYLKEKIFQLRDRGQGVTAQLIEEQMQVTIDRALNRLAYQVGRGQITVRF